MKDPFPWYRKSQDAWYVWFDDKQHRLGKHPEDAPAPRKKNGRWNPPTSILDIFYKFMSSKGLNPLPPNDRLTVAWVCDLFLQHSEKHNKPKTFGLYRDYSQDFCDHYGRLVAAELKPFHVTNWLDKHKDWKSSRRNAVTAIKRVFNWACNEGILDPNPIRNVRKPSASTRQRILTKVERQEILQTIRDEEFREFVFAMQETGCRPSEVSRVTTDNVNLELGIWFFNEHKTMAKTGRPRIVYLTPAMVELTKKLLAKHPTGPLFRGLRGTPFNANTVCSRFQRLRQKLPHLKDAVAYAYRHSFATDALASGKVGIAQVAELLGHTSTDMVHRHYSHIAENLEYMKEVARKAANPE